MVPLLETMWRGKRSEIISASSCCGKTEPMGALRCKAKADSYILRDAGAKASPTERPPPFLRRGGKSMAALLLSRLARACPVAATHNAVPDGHASKRGSSAQRNANETKGKNTMKPETLFWFLPMLAAMVMVLWAGIGWGLNHGYSEAVTAYAGTSQAGRTQTDVAPLVKRLLVPILLLSLLGVALGACLAISHYKAFPVDLIYYLCGGGCCLAMLAVVEAIRRIVTA